MKDTVRQFPSRVEIAAGGHSVAVEADESLTKVAATAKDLFRHTDDDSTKGVGTTVGFHTELQPQDAEIPEQLHLRRMKGNRRP